jgi:hypothetical protein
LIATTCITKRLDSTGQNITLADHLVRYSSLPALVSDKLSNLLKGDVNVHTSFSSTEKQRSRRSSGGGAGAEEDQKKGSRGGEAAEKVCEQNRR